MSSFIAKIKSLSPSGHGIADNGYYILGLFPGDTACVSLYKTAENINYAEIIEIIKSSPYRSYTPTKTPFFDSNAPWQHLDIKSENRFKKK